jgi:Tol biopolymer transport system component
MSVRVMVAGLLVVLWVLLAATPAQATYPGANGKLGAIEDDDHLVTINPDGSAQTRPGLPARTVSWSPDGRKVAYSDSALRNPGPISVANADGSNPTPLTPGGFPTWSPDGKKIALVNEGGLYVINANGTNLRLVTSLPGALDPKWSPDGRQIALYKDFDIWTINSDGTGLKNLTNTSIRDFYGIELAPSWSPDSSRIVFGANSFDIVPPNFFQLFVVNRDGTARKQIPTRVPATFSAWSPDGLQIAFSDLNCSGPYGSGPFADCGIWIMNVDGTDLHQIISSMSFGILDWQPIPPPAFKNASQKCKAQAGNYRNHGQCVKANK